MCPDNPTTRNKPDDTTRIVNENIGAYVQREIFASPRWASLRRRYPGIPDLELLKAAVLQADFIIYLDIQPSVNRVVFREEEFAR